MTPKVEVGDRVTIDRVVTATGELALGATVTVERVNRLGCGCVQYVAARPGGGGITTHPLHIHDHSRCRFAPMHTRCDGGAVWAPAEGPTL